VELGLELGKLSLGQLQQASPRIGPDVYDHLGPANVVAHYAPQCAAGPRQLREQLAFWKKELR
jgi:argininosuccinate lyase